LGIKRLALVPDRKIDVVVSSSNRVWFRSNQIPDFGLLIKIGEMISGVNRLRPYSFRRFPAAR